MDFFMNNILNIVCYLPLAGMILIMFIKRENENAIKWIANITAFIGFLVSIPLLTSFNDPRFIGPNGFRFVYEHSWIPQIGANYKLGIDGISMLLVLLTTLLGFIAILSSWTAIKERVKEYYAFMLLLQTGMIGVFMSLDFLVFYVFWEVMLVPMYFLIGVWGGPRKLYAAIKFFLYTLAGSVLMLVGILAIYFYQHDVTGHLLLRHSRLPEARLPDRSSVLGVPGLLRRICHQGSDVPVPHLVAGCPRRSADRRIGHPGRRSAEDGNLRFRALLAADVSLGDHALPEADADSLPDRHHLRRRWSP